jgi:hypothetical protein
MPHSSGQRHGLFRNSDEMPHSVSPGCTVCESGALGARSASGTPACATRLAVSRHSGVTGMREPACGQRHVMGQRQGQAGCRQGGMAAETFTQAHHASVSGRRGRQCQNAGWHVVIGAGA